MLSFYLASIFVTLTSFWDLCRAAGGGDKKK